MSEHISTNGMMVLPLPNIFLQVCCVSNSEDSIFRLGFFFVFLFFFFDERSKPVVEAVTLQRGQQDKKRCFWVHLMLVFSVAVMLLGT